MPYRIKGNVVVKGNTDRVVGRSANSKRYLRVLQAVEHGWKISKRGGAKVSREERKRIARKKIWNKYMKMRGGDG